MSEKMDYRTKRAAAGRAGARRRWGATREATRMVRVFTGDAETLGLIASTSADAVHWLLSASKMSVYRSSFVLDTRDAKALWALQEQDSSHPRFVEGVRVFHPTGERVVAISFPVEKIGEVLDAAHLEYGENAHFRAELGHAAKVAQGHVAVAVFPFENP